MNGGAAVSAAEMFPGHALPHPCARPAAGGAFDIFTDSAEHGLMPCRVEQGRSMTISRRRKARGCGAAVESVA